MWYFSWVQSIVAVVFYFIFENRSIVVFIAMDLFLSFLK